MSKKYFGNWSSHTSMVESFSEDKFDYDTNEYTNILPENFPADEEVVFAVYDTGDNTGKGTILFYRDGKLLEVSGSHCSCNGIRECWNGKGAEVTWEALALRVPEFNDDHGWHFLSKADAETQNAFVELVARNASGQALLDALNNDSLSLK